MAVVGFLDVDRRTYVTQLASSAEREISSNAQTMFNNTSSVFRSSQDLTACTIFYFPLARRDQ